MPGLNDSEERPLVLFVTAGQITDYFGAQALIGSIPKVDWLLRDRSNDADWFPAALKDKGVRASILGCKQRKTPVKYDKVQVQTQQQDRDYLRQAQGLEARRYPL